MTISSTLYGLLPSQLMHTAWASTGGDPCEGGLGVHKGHPDAVDNLGLTKTDLHDAASRCDVEFFDRIVNQARQERTWFRSRRTWVPKKDGGVRPVDSPSEIKRLVALRFRRKLEDLVQERHLLRDTIIGFRSTGEITSWCPSEHATIQDQFASCVFKLIRKFSPFAVKVDLRDAFGEVPHRAIHEALKELGLSHEIRRRIVELVRINSVDKQGRSYRKFAYGIEQGNPLSALLLNLTINLLFSRISTRIGERRVAAYGDDLVLVAATCEEATAAFHVLVEEARTLGFRNVRALGDEGKASRIYDTRINSIPLIHTYEVGAHAGGVGLTPEKLEELREKLVGIAKQKQKQEINARLIRRTAGCSAISKSWMRKVGLLQPRESGTGTGDADDDNHFSNVPKAKENKSSDVVGSQEDSITEDAKQSPMVSATMGGSIPVPMGTEDVDHYGDSVGVLVERDVEGVPVDPLLQEREPPLDVHPPHEGRKDEERGGHEVDVPVSLPTRARGDTLLDLESTTGAEAGTHPEGNGSGTYQIGRAVTPSLSPVTGVTGGAPRQVRGAPPGPVLRLLDVPGVVEAVVYGRKLKVGDRWKGYTLDLRGLGCVIPVGTTDDEYIGAINRLLSVVRTKGKVWVLVHPGEPWTSIRGILGNDGDRVWRQTQQVHMEGGEACKLQVQTVACRKLGCTAMPSGVDVMIAGTRRTGARTWSVTVTGPDGKRHRRQVDVQSPVVGIGRIEAIAAVVATTDPGAVIAVRMMGALPRLLVGGAGPVQVDLRRAILALRRARTWTVGRDRLVGR